LIQNVDGLFFVAVSRIKPTEKILIVITDIMVSKGKQSEAINFLNKELKKNHQNLAQVFHEVGWRA
jgi:uncharacterized protein YoaH (UPF0181 family)